MPERDGEELQAYRRAAEDALQQLDWCIGYLHGIRKTEISAALSRNRHEIRRTLLSAPGEPDAAEEPLPSSVTEEP